MQKKVIGTVLFKQSVVQAIEKDGLSFNQARNKFYFFYFFTSNL